MRYFYIGLLQIAAGVAVLGGLGAAVPAVAYADEGNLPVVSGTPPVNATIGEPFSYQFTVTGADSTRVMGAGADPTRVIALPEGLEWDGDTMTLSGTPAVQAGGSYPYSIIARNTEGFDKKTFDLQLTGTRITDSEFYFFPGRSRVGIFQSCPDSHPYLINEHLAPGRILPHGVEVDADEWMGVSSWAETRDGYQSGVANLSMEDWDISADAPWGEATIILHCTNDTTDAKLA
jgi:hypothetical protein